MGTVPYMSPEQALGREVDHRTDMFSLGAVLYEMATGRLPFSGANTSETMDRILHAQPEAMARFNYEVPAELERIVRKCLEKDRERRYQSARELLVDLTNLKRDSDPGNGGDTPPQLPAGRQYSSVYAGEAMTQVRHAPRIAVDDRRWWALASTCSARVTRVSRSIPSRSCPSPIRIVTGEQNTSRMA